MKESILFSTLILAPMILMQVPRRQKIARKLAIWLLAYADSVDFKLGSQREWTKNIIGE